jgi:hypothetical protein
MKHFLPRAFSGLAAGRAIVREPAAAQHVWCFGPLRAFAILAPETKEATKVDIALKLNVLAVCAVFLFVGAVLLGAF